jgi:hypothetical protein
VSQKGGCNGVPFGSCSRGNYSDGGVEVGGKNVEKLLGGWVRTSGWERGLFVSRGGGVMGIGMVWVCRR